MRKSVSSAEIEWKSYLEELKKKGYNDTEIKSILVKKGYPEKIIDELLTKASEEKAQVKEINLSNPKNIFLVVLLLFVVILGIFLINFIQSQKNELPPAEEAAKLGITENSTPGWINNALISNVYPNHTNDPNGSITSPSIETIRKNTKLSSKERNYLANILDESFYKSCMNNDINTRTCTPTVIDGYIEAKYILESSLDSTEQEGVKRALEFWRKYFRGAEFNIEGGVSNDVLSENYIATKNNRTIIQFYYFIYNLPVEDRAEFRGKVDNVNPRDIEKRLHLLMIYRELYGPKNFSAIPLEIRENSIFLREVCTQDLNKVLQNPMEKDYSTRVVQFCEQRI